VLLMRLSSREPQKCDEKERERVQAEVFTVVVGYGQPFHAKLLLLLAAELPAVTLRTAQQSPGVCSHSALPTPCVAGVHTSTSWSAGKSIISPVHCML